MIFWYSCQLNLNFILFFLRHGKNRSKNGKRDVGAFTIEEVCDIQNFSQELSARLKLHNLRGTFKFCVLLQKHIRAEICLRRNATKLHKFITNHCFWTFFWLTDKELSFSLFGVASKRLPLPDGTKINKDED